MARRPTPNQKRIIEKLVADLEPTIAAAFLAAIQAAAGSIDANALIDALEARDIERAVALFKIDQGLLWPLQEAVRGGYVAGGASVAAALPTAIAGSFGFAGGHPRAQAWIATEGARLIQGIQADTLAMARDVITKGMVDNTGAREVARELTGRVVAGKRTGGFIGLTTQQTDSIISGRAKLASGDTALMREYLGLAQRDKRFDGLVNKAIADGKAVGKADLDRIIDAHKSKALGYRGKVIAKNEAFSAQAAGRREAYTQVLGRDDVQQITKQWRHASYNEFRPAHKALDGVTIDFNEDFDVGGVMMSQPHDPRGGAAESINCRCTVFHRVIVAKE